jgi:hypothetical protein
VGVDGDGDGERNPQDLDDAALATAVYLCSGDEDLATRAGQESAVYRYNHSNEYVSLVLSIMAAYAEGDYSAVPNSSSGATTFIPSYGDSVVAPGTSGYSPSTGDRGNGGKGGKGGKSGQGGNLGWGGGSGSGGTGGSSGGDTGGDTGGDLGGDTGGGIIPDTGGDSGGDGGGGGSVGDLVGKVTKDLTGGGSGGSGGGGGGTGGSGGSGGGDGGSTGGGTPDPGQAVEDTLTWAEAKTQCLASGISALNVPALTKCIEGLIA